MPTVSGFYIDTLASSTDGMTLIGAEFSGSIYTSTNGGQFWLKRSAGGTAPISWRSVAISGDGTKMVGGTLDNNVFTSTDGGATWTQRSPAGGATLRGYHVSISGDGSTIVASRTGYVHISTDDGATWSTTTPTGATTSTSFQFSRVSNDGTRIIVGAISDYVYISTNRGVGWTQRNPAGTAQNFRAGGISSDGTRLTVAAQNDYVYTSTDGGVNWTQRSQIGSQSWLGVDTSSDGMKIVVIDTISNRPVYISTDGGANWTTQTPFQTSNGGGWRAVAMSGDGANIAVAASGDFVYTTTDSGSSWVVRNPKLTAQYIASSTDGMHMAVADATRGWVYVTVDGGTTWTQVDPTGSPTSYRGIAMSADGTQIFTLNSRSVYKSTDGGATWNSYDVAATPKNWRWIASTGDGMKLVAVAYLDYVYTSTDGGQTWTQHDPANGTQVWQNAALSADGTKIVTTISDNATGAVYISNNSGVNWTAVNPSGVANTGYRAVTVSADGTTITVACNNARIYTSTDGGATWTSSRPAPSDTALSWQAMAASADGTKLVLASIGYEYVFTSIDKGATWTPHNVAGDVRWYRGAVMSADGKKIAIVAENDFVWTSSGTFLTVDPPILTIHGGLVTTGGECVATNSSGSAIASLTVGGVAATNITVLDGCNISFISPPLAVGLYDVVITYNDASSETHINMLTYEEPTIALDLAGDGLIEASLSTGGFGATLITATVATNSPLGYKLDLSASDTDLVCSESGRGSDILSAMSGSGLAISSDTWAYGLGSGPSPPADLPTIWRGVTTTDYTIDNYGVATAGRDSHVYFGAQITAATRPCNSYDGEVMFTATAN